MGYTTYFEGQFTVEPPLNAQEIAYLTDFAETRRVDRERGPYFVGDRHVFGSGMDACPDIRNYNKPPEGQPGLWCQWVPTEDGKAIQWDEGEKAYYMEEWIVYIIDHFLRPGAHAQGCGDAQFSPFTFDHKVNGVVYASGEDPGDLWAVRIVDNVVTVYGAQIAYVDGNGNRL